jgi:hypothetical protein
VPLEWARSSSLLKKNCLVRAFNHSLWVLEVVGISRRLKKQNNQINRLKRLGKLKFERILDFEIFQAILDEITAQSDFRKGAMYNITPFEDDPLRKELLSKLYKHDILHVTVLKLNEEIIACNVGTIDGKSMILQGLNSNAPFYTNNSPGILHFLMLGKLLAEEGYTVFDLTPGEDPYKERLATVNGQAYELVLAGSLRSLVRSYITKLYFDKIVKHKKNIYNAVSVLKFSPKVFRHSIRRIKITKEKLGGKKNSDFRTFINGLLNMPWTPPKYKVYKVNNLTPVKYALSIKRDNLKDLIKYEYKGSKLLRGEFLTKAMEKFRRGEHVYTKREGNSNLLCCVWIKERINKFDIQGTSKTILLPEVSTVLYDVYFRSENKENLKDFLVTSANLLSARNNETNIYIIVNTLDTALCKTFEDAAFTELTAP